MPRLLRLALVCMVAATCATNPATGRRQLMLMTEAEEIQLGRTSDKEVRDQMGVYADAELQRYVDAIGQRLARASHRPALPWTFTVVDASAVNAFALPGGFIYVTRGILPFMRDEAELAAVIGHEVGHVDARHSAAAYSRQTLIGGGLAIGSVLSPKIGAVQGAAELAAGLMFLKHGRDAELESDRLGVGYAAATGWAPGAMIGLLGTLGRLDEAGGSSRGVPNWLLTHPPAADRVAKVQEAVAAASGAASGAATNRPAFERRLDGLVFGDSREQGMVRGSDFVHPILRLAMRFPSGWTIANGADAVRSQPPDESAALLLQLVDGAGTSAADAARTVTSRAGFTEISGGTAQVNGLTPFVGTYQGQMNNQAVRLRAAFFHLPPARADQFVMIAGIAPTAGFAAATNDFDAAIRSMRALSQAEADRIQPNRVDFYVVRPGDTWDKIARGPSGGVLKAASLAIMNGSDPGAQPRAGDRIRIVVGG
jgi:predicted Zn-dependent protease